MGVRRADASDPPRRAPARRRWRIGLIDIYLLRGTAGAFVIVLAAVVVALMLERALRLIHEMAARGADLAYFLPLLGQLFPYYLALAVPIAFMAAVVLLVARLDRRLELEAMVASGLSLARIAAPLVTLGMLLSALALWAGGWLEPHGRYGFRALRIEAVNAGRIGALQPRALFQSGQDLVVTFDRHLPEGGVAGVFLWQRLEDGEELALSGASGQIGFARGGRTFGVDFASGRYVLQEAGRAPAGVDFERLEFREELLPRDARWARGWDQKELTLPELAQEARTGARGLPRRAVEAELYGRMARAAIIPLVPLLVLPLAIATKRRSRTPGVLLCGAFLLAANHGLNLAKNLALLGWGQPGPVMAAAFAVLGLLVGALFVSSRTLPSHSPVHSVLDGISAAASRLASRARGLSGRRARSLGSYLAGQLGKSTLLALVLIAAFLQMIDLVDQGDEFFERGLGARDIARYALLRLPAIVQQAAPIAALAGAMAAFALFATAREMTAIGIAGISQWRVLLMTLPVSLALMAAVFVLAEWLTPTTQVRLAAWWAATEPATGDQSAQPRWFRIGDAIVRVGAASADGARLHDVEVFSRDGEGRLDRRIVAERAEFAGGAWSLADAEVARFDGGRIERTWDTRLAWDASLRPRDVAAFFAAAPALSATSARRVLDHVAPVNRGETMFSTRLHRSVAEPLAPLIMLLLALPLAFVPPRTARSWPAMLYAGGGGLVYLVADGVLTVAAQVGYVSPAFGAWAAPAFGTLIAVEVLLVSER